MKTKEKGEKGRERGKRENESNGNGKMERDIGQCREWEFNVFHVQ